MITLNDELAGQCLAECRERLATTETDLLAIETGGAEINEERINRVLRAVCEVKTGAGLFDLVKLRDLAQQTEDVLALIRSRAIVLTPVAIGVLLRATGLLDDLLQNPGASDRTDTTKLTGDLARLRADRPASAGSCQSGRRPRVLLVEDDFACRLVLQTFLSRYGECHIAVNGREAVEAFRSAFDQGRKYDLICMDIMMPEMDGSEAVRQVRACEEAHGILWPSGAKIVMTTAVDDIKEVFRSFRDLCDEYLVKPIDLSKLLGYMKACRLVP